MGIVAGTDATRTVQDIAVFVSDHFHELGDFKAAAMDIGDTSVNAAQLDLIGFMAAKLFDQRQDDVSTTTASAIDTYFLLIHLLHPHEGKRAGLLLNTLARFPWSRR